MTDDASVACDMRDPFGPCHRPGVVQAVLMCRHEHVREGVLCSHCVDRPPNCAPCNDADGHWCRLRVVATSAPKEER